MANAPVAKKAKIDEDDDFAELIHAVWEHYRNYVDSLDPGEDEEGNQDADIDELQELIEITKTRIPKPSLPLEKNTHASDLGIGSVEIVCPRWQSRKEMIPILLSVAYYHLADGAISEYLIMQQQKQEIATSDQVDDDEGIGWSSDIATTKEIAQNLLVLSLQWYPYNAATWSMGANFGRMSQSLSQSSSRKWYEMAVHASTVIRERALEALNDESIPSEEKEWIELLVLNQVLGVEYEDDEDEEGDEEKDEEAKTTENGDQNETNDRDKGETNGEDDDEVDTGWYSASAVESTSRFMCAMLWSMDGRHDHALDHLKPFRLSHRLHPNVWRISPPLQPTSLKAAPTEPPLAFQPKGGIIPTYLYDSMKKVFAPDAAYWRESDYSTRGYYSFFHDVDAADEKQPRNLIEEVIINHLLPRAQQCLDSMPNVDDEERNSEDSTKICGFEWWTHTRPIQANLGHNLHFDTDESMLDQEGKVTHPVLSSILYLTGGSKESSSPAGATIILDETPDSTAIGNKCWQGIPKDNTFLIFPGNRLHGVLPCPGNQKEDEREIVDKNKPLDPKTLMHNWKNEKTAETADATASCSEGPPTRLTFMVGFWTRNVPAKMKRRSLYGPCGPLPPATEEHTWVIEITKGYNDGTTKRPVANKMMTATALPQVSPAWEIIGTDNEDEDENEVDKGPYPIIPHGIDHRFFVQGAPDCFRRSLFEDRDVDDS
jgi:hypothetical protein